MRRTLAILLLVLVGCAASPPDPSPGAVAIVNVTVLDGRGGPPIDNAAVILRDGTITEVRPNARLPRSMRTIDGRGGYLLPGYIDMHAHLLVPRCDPSDAAPVRFDRNLSEQMLGTLLDFGITTVRSPATPTVQGLALRDDLNAGRVQGPHALASAELINDATLDEAALRRYVREALPRRPDYFKVYAALAPDQVEVVIDEAHRHGVPVIGHLQRTSWLEGARLGIDHLTHAVDWSSKTLPEAARPAYAAAIRDRGAMRARLDWLELLRLEAPEVQEMIDEIARRGISVDPTLVAYDTKFSGPDAVRYRANRFVDIVPDLARDWRACPSLTADWTTDDRRRWRRLFPKMQALVKLMHDRGVLLTTGTDLTNEWVIPGESLHQEFELLAEAGLPSATILRMTGANASKALGRPDVGVVEAGRRADLVLLSADPLRDIRNTRRIVWVMQAGRIVSDGPPAE